MSYDAFKLCAYYAVTESGFDGSEFRDAMQKAMIETGGTRDFADTRDVAYLIYCRERRMEPQYS